MPITVCQINKFVAAAKLQDFFPKCYEARKRRPEIPPLECFRGACSANQRCMESLAPKIRTVFDQLPTVKAFLLYWKEPNQPGDDIHACKFWSDTEKNPELTIIHAKALAEMLGLGDNRILRTQNDSAHV